LAEKIAQKIDTKTIVKCKDLEVVEGDLNFPLWVMEVKDKIKVVLDIEEYINILNMSKKLLKENFELRLEKAILGEFPIDYEDVKAVVLEEMKRYPDKNIEDIVHKVKIEHPNLFYNLDLDKMF